MAQILDKNSRKKGASDEKDEQKGQGWVFGYQHRFTTGASTSQTSTAS